MKGKKSKKQSRVLVLEPDEQLANEISDALSEAAPGAQLKIAGSLEEAQSLVTDARPDLFVLDLDAAPDLGQDFLYDLRTSHPSARAIILTGANIASEQNQMAGLGAIHFLEKPFPREDFVELVEPLLRPADGETEKFRGTLSDLHMADIIQLKCMGGASAVLEFTGPRGEKARVYFDKGQVYHASAPGRSGLAAFNEIVTWKGGMISEVADAAPVPRTINQDWQLLLMEAMRKSDEAKATSSPVTHSASNRSATRRVLVVDDSLMLLRFVEEVLLEANFQVTIAPTGAEGLQSARNDRPDLVLLDFVLPDMKGDEVSRRLHEDSATAGIPVIYMSGFGADLTPERETQANVIGFLNKPFTSDLLIKTVENHMPKLPGEPEPTEFQSGAPDGGFGGSEFMAPEEEITQGTGGAGADEWWSPPPGSPDWSQPQPEAVVEPSMAPGAEAPDESVTGGAYFCGDTNFFSLNWALQTIAKQQLTGALHAFWGAAPVDLLAQGGQIVLATTRDADLYCPESPITLSNIEADRIAAARAEQNETGCPMFLILSRDGTLLRDPAIQLVQHYGQKLVAQLWTSGRVRFMFEQMAELPAYASEITPEPEVDHWALSSLRFIQFQDLGAQANYDPSSIPAYTKDGFDRVQNLKLTVAEAQFASQFNGVRSIAQIAKNLRLDLKFARLTLFRFLALEIVECWSSNAVPKQESKGIFQRFTRSIGVGE